MCLVAVRKEIQFTCGSSGFIPFFCLSSAQLSAYSRAISLIVTVSYFTRVCDISLPKNNSEDSCHPQSGSRFYYVLTILITGV